MVSEHGEVVGLEKTNAGVLVPAAFLEEMEQDLKNYT